MVKWRDPETLLSTDSAFVKLVHVLGGIYIWEWVTTCEFDLDILTGKRPRRWPTWVYLTVRLSTLVALTLLMASSDSSGSTDCEVAAHVLYTICYIGLASASLIIVIRISAIWNFNRMALGIAIGAWLASIALNIRDLIILRSQFDPQERICSLPATNRSLANVIGILASDLVLLTTMLIGLLRYREGCFGRFGLWRLLFQQGLMWFVLATVAEVPNVVLASINLNEVWDVVFQPVTLVILAIGSTRMYRYLSEYSSITVFNFTDESGAVATGSIHFRRPAGDSAARMTPDDAADAIPMDIHLEIEREEACTLGKKAHVLA